MHQSQLFTSEKTTDALNIDMPDANVCVYPHWLSQADATQAFDALYNELRWEQQEIVIFSKRHKSPRLQAWHGDKEAVYMYSGLKMAPLPWSNTLSMLKTKCEQVSGTSFNSVLANLYRDGSDSMGLHADNESELGEAPVIASVSLGATRNLDFVHNRTKQKVRVPLTHGSLMLMQGQTQTHWKHGINKSKRVTMPRINLTFRFIHQA